MDEKNSMQINMLDYVSNHKIENIEEKQLEQDKSIEVQEIKNEVNTNFNNKNILTKEEYEELCRKYARGEDLTLDELKALRKATEVYANEEDLQDLFEEKGPALVPKSNNNQTGFAHTNFMLYVLILTLFIGLMATLFFKV